MDKWNKIESPEKSPTTMDTLSLTNEAKMNNGEETISLKSGAGKTGLPHVKKKKNKKTNKQPKKNRTLSNTTHENKLKME